MGGEIREAIYMAVELMVFSALLMIIVVLSGQGREMLTTHEANKAITQEMRAYKDFSSYDNRELTGDDMLLAIKKYARAYNVCIVHDDDDNGTFDTISYHSKNAPDHSIQWEDEKIRAILGDLIYSNYIAKFLTMDEVVNTDYDSVYPSCVDATDASIPNPSTKIIDEVLIFELQY